SETGKSPRGDQGTGGSRLTSVVSRYGHGAEFVLLEGQASRRRDTLACPRGGAEPEICGRPIYARHGLLGRQCPGPGHRAARSAPSPDARKPAHTVSARGRVFAGRTGQRRFGAVGSIGKDPGEDTGVPA